MKLGGESSEQQKAPSGGKEDRRNQMLLKDSSFRISKSTLEIKLGVM